MILADIETFHPTINSLHAALSMQQTKDHAMYDEDMVMRVRDLEPPLISCSKLLDQLKVTILSYLKPTDQGQRLKFLRWFITKNKVNEIVGSFNHSKVTLNTVIVSITMYVINFSFVKTDCIHTLSTCAPFSVASRHFNKGNRLKARFRFCIFRLRDFESNSKAPVNLEQVGKDTDIGSALQRYVKAASIARSLTSSMQNLDMDDVSRYTFLPESVNTTPSTHLSQIYDATQKVRKADNQRTALHNAAKSGEELYIVEILLESGADVNAKTANGTTALHLAAQYGNENAARVLLEHGANVHARTVPPKDDLIGRKFAGGRTPLHWAAVEGHDAVVELLLDHHADPGAKNTTYRTPLQEAIMHGNELVARILIKRGAPIDDQDDEAWTPLHQASYAVGRLNAQTGQAAIAELLLDSGAHIDAVTTDSSVLGNDNHCRCTPLLLAAATNAIEVAELLVKRGADLRACRKRGETAIHVAAWKGNISIVRMLLDAGVEIDIRDKLWNETPLYKAACQNHLPVSQLLHERGADLRACNRDGGMAFHYAAFFGHVDSIRMMLDFGVDVEIRDLEWNETALHKAASQDRLSATKLLLERGADPRAVSGWGRDVLQHTIAVQKNGNPEIVRLLKERLEILKRSEEEKLQEGLEKLQE